MAFDEFTEQVEFRFMNIYKIFVSDPDHPTGRLVYTGFVLDYNPFIKGKTQGVKIILLGMITLLTFDYYKNGSNYTVAHSGQDPSAIMKAIIDHFKTIYPSWLIGYDSGGTTVNSVGVNVSYTFEDDKWFDALQNAFGTVGPGWFWCLNEAAQLCLKPKPTSAVHTFTIGKDLEEVDGRKSAQDIINDVVVRYSNF